MQFHVEVDLAAVVAFATDFAQEARAAGVDPQRIISAADAALAEMALARETILGRFVQLVSRYEPDQSRMRAFPGNCLETSSQARNV